MTGSSFLPAGQFSTGCNYWASHAGTAMWSDWRPRVVAADLALLARQGLTVLRVFPIWPDFQPIHRLRGGHGRPVEFRFGETVLPDTEWGRAGISAEAMARFQFLADEAGARGLKLIVGLLTGWMSGRLFMPPALEGLNPLTDARALQWEIRFVREFVRHFRGHPAIAAWDLGNECNCMGSATREEAWTWTAAIAQTIRSEDASRPVISGMHSLPVDAEQAWNLADQGELTDVLTTHPYPPFTPHCDLDRIDSIRSILHSTAETCLYADVGRKPALVEEVGTLGPMYADRATAAAFARAAMWSAWAHDGRGFLWWCAFDQDHLDPAPYDWCTIERELGLCTSQRRPKPVIRELGAFQAFVQRLPVRALPPRRREAVCLLSRDQDQWGVAYMAFALAKQAGWDLTFCGPDQAAPEASLYLAPALRGIRQIPRHRWQAILRRIREGGTLYLSMDDGVPDQFEALTGLSIRHRSRRKESDVEARLDGNIGVTLNFHSDYRLDLKPVRAEVLGVEADGNPLFTRARYGRGWVYFCSCSPEKTVVSRPGAFAVDAPPYWRIYDRVASAADLGRVLLRRNPSEIGLTEHPAGARQRWVVAINYGAETEGDFECAAGWRIAAVYRNRGGRVERQTGGVGRRWRCRLPGQEALLLDCRRGG